MPTVVVTKRKCRNPDCAKVTMLAFFAEVCPACKTPYGKWEVGLDRTVDTAKPEKPPKRR